MPEKQKRSVVRVLGPTTELDYLHFALDTKLRWLQIYSASVSRIQNQAVNFTLIKL